MAADPNSFDHYRRGEPLRALKSVNSFGFDHYRRGEPLRTLVGAAVGITYEKAGAIISAASVSATNVVEAVETVAVGHIPPGVTDALIRRILAEAALREQDDEEAVAAVLALTI